jgi:hypothetical protein
VYFRKSDAIRKFILEAGVGGKTHVFDLGKGGYAGG